MFKTITHFASIILVFMLTYVLMISVIDQEQLHDEIEVVQAKYVEWEVAEKTEAIYLETKTEIADILIEFLEDFKS